MSEEGVIDLIAQRRATHDFRWASRTLTTMPYFVRGEKKKPMKIVTAVLQSQNVQSVIRQIAKDRKVNEDKVRKEGKQVLVELAHDYQQYTVRWFSVILSKMSKRLYNSIQVDTKRLDEIKLAYQCYPVLLLPTHRSYVDFLLVSYLSFSFDLTLPVIAAGMDFKGMVGVGELLRKSGAFYIRRRFGDDLLYWALISEYVKTAMLEGGHPLEMFVEGTRSRTGKSLKPKIGLLSIITELVTSGQIPDILILPISMSYDRTLEERLYAHELLGTPKPPESTNGLMKALKWLGKQNYGSVYVNFGSLISIREMLERSSPDFSSGRIRTQPNPQIIQGMALSVVLAQQANLVVPLIAGISLVISTEISRESVLAMPIEALMESLVFLESILKSRQLRFGYPLMREPLEVNVRFIMNVHSALFSIRKEPSGKETVICNLEDGEDGGTAKLMVFQHYANQVLSPLFPLCVTALLMESQDVKDMDEKKILDDYVFMRELFQEEFLYESDKIAQEYEWAMVFYKTGNWTDMEQPAGGATCLDYDWAKNLNNARLLRRALEPYFIAYLEATRKLQEILGVNPSIRFEVKDFAKDCQAFMRELMKSGTIVKAYGALSLESISNAVLSHVRALALERVKMENGSFGIVLRDPSRLASISNRLDRLVGREWRSGDTEKHSSKAELFPAGTTSGCDQREPNLVLRSKL